MPFNLQNYFSQKKSLIDSALRTRWMLPEDTDPAILHKAMHYSLFAPGKRMRPILVFAAGEALGLSNEDVLPIAACLEMIHVYSLIHDDLPCMDDDDLRRGQPTNHKVFGESFAVLAGDNLLTNAFIPLTELDTKKFSPTNILAVIKAVALAAGSQGMVAGQVIDIESEGKQISLERLKTLHKNKTGALIRIAVESPSILSIQSIESIASSKTHQALANYAETIGLAFQIVDDILDVTGGTELGKDIGSDAEKGKPTYVSLLGLDAAKQEAQKALTTALDALKDFGTEAEPLREIARFVVERKI